MLAFYGFLNPIQWTLVQYAVWIPSRQKHLGSSCPFCNFYSKPLPKKEHAVSIFVDLEKAYDTTWKYGMLKDLFDMGLKGKLPNFISNFLSDR